MYLFVLDLEHHSNSEHSHCVSHKVFFLDVAHSYMTYLLEKIVRPYDGWPRSSRLRKVNVVNHWPDDQEFLYFLKFRSIYRYNVHESDLEVSGVQFDLKRFIIWSHQMSDKLSIIDTECFLNTARDLSPGSDSFSILVNISYADCDFCFGRLYPKWFSYSGSCL